MTDRYEEDDNDYLADEMDEIGDDMEGDDEENHIVGCACKDCDNDAVVACAGCGIAEYCSEEHMLADWKNHVAECNVCIAEGLNPRNVFWAAEVADEATDNAPVVTWEPAHSLHGRLARDGTVTDTVLNETLLANMGDRKTQGIEAAAVDGGFKKMSVMKNEAKKSGLPSGEVLRGGDVIVELSFATEWLQPPVYRVQYEAPIEHLSTGTKGGDGMTFFVNPQEMKRASSISGNLVTQLNGMKSNGYVATVSVTLPNKKTYFVSGGVVFGKISSRGRMAQRRREADYLAYTGGAAAQRSNRRARRRAAATIRKLPQLIRFTGVDSDGVEASIVLGRERKTNSTTYTVRSFGIHIPRGVVPPPSPAMVPDGAGSPYTESLATRLDIDRENIVHILACAEAVGEKAEATRVEFAHARETAGPTSIGATNLHRQLSTEVGIRATLMEHAARLNDEENGAIEVHRIPTSVDTAIGSARQLIGLSIRERAVRAMETAKLLRRVKYLDDRDLKQEFIQTVDQLSDARNVGDVGTQYLQRARIIREEILKRPYLMRDTQIDKAMRELTEFRGSDRSARRGKINDRRLTAKRESIAKGRAYTDRLRGRSVFTDNSSPEGPVLLPPGEKF